MATITERNDSTVDITLDNGESYSFDYAEDDMYYISDLISAAVIYQGHLLRRERAHAA